GAGAAGRAGRGREGRRDEGVGQGVRRPVRRRPRGCRQDRLGRSQRAEGAGLRRAPRPGGFSKTGRRSGGEGGEGARNRPSAGGKEMTGGSTVNPPVAASRREPSPTHRASSRPGPPRPAARATRTGCASGRTRG